jgi:integrase
MIFKGTGRRFYAVKFKWNGTVIQRRTKATTAKDARAIEGRLRSELAKGNFGILRPSRPMTLAEFLKHDFAAFNSARFEVKPKTLNYYDYGARLLRDADIASLRLDEITSQHAAGFAAQHASMSPSTVNCALRTLRRALNLAEKWGKLTKAPDIELAKGERQRERVVTDAEFATYIALCRQPWRDVALLIRGEAMPPGECFKLRWEHITLNDGGLIRIHEGKTKARRRQLPMVPEVHRVLLDRFEQQGSPSEGWVFPSGSASGHFEQDSAKNQHAAALRGLAAAGAKVKPFEPYCLRHTALTRFAESGCDAFTLAKIAGHSSITITQRYCHPQAEAIQNAFARLAAPDASAEPPKRQKGLPMGVTTKKRALPSKRTNSR